MKADGLFIIAAIFFIFAAWVATGGPSRPISSAGPFITPVTRPGEESQGYRYLVPANPINAGSYPSQVAGGSGSVITSGPDAYARASAGGGVYIERSPAGTAAQNPNQEYLALGNAGARAVSAAGWTLESGRTGARVSLPAGAMIAPSGTLIVASGRASADRNSPRTICSTPTENCVFLNRNFELWAADRETITLRDAQGKEIDSFSY